VANGAGKKAQLNADGTGGAFIRTFFAISAVFLLNNIQPMPSDRSYEKDTLDRGSSSRICLDYPCGSACEHRNWTSGDFPASCGSAGAGLRASSRLCLRPSSGICRAASALGASAAGCVLRTLPGIRRRASRLQTGRGCGVRPPMARAWLQTLQIPRLLSIGGFPSLLENWSGKRAGSPGSARLRFDCAL
jgi:hypothetical protein